MARIASPLTCFLNTFSAKLEPPVRQHLKNVYGCVSLATVSAAAGAYVHMYTEILQAGLLTTLAALGCLIALGTMQDTGKNMKMRMGLLLGFAFLSGLGLGPLLEIVISIDPSIVVTALVGTTVIFTSFSISALMAPRGQWLYLGGALISLSNISILLVLSNIFLRSMLVYQAQLYIGLFLMSGFIIFDTQFIVEKFQMGNKDFIGHALELFIDFIRVFRYLVEILTIKEQNKRKRDQ